MTKFIAPILALMVLAGCTGTKPGSDPGDHEKSSIGIALTDALASQGLQLVFDAPNGANLTGDYNGVENPFPPAAGSACGFIGFATVHNGQRQVSFGRALSASKGHAVTVATGARPLTLNHTTAQETLFLAINETSSIGNISVKPGEQVVVEAAYNVEGDSSLVAAKLSLVASHKLKLNRTVLFQFHCGANLGDFEGQFFVQGENPSTTAVVSAHREYTTNFNGQAAFLLLGYPRFQSTCDTKITVDGRSVAASGMQTNLCSLSAQTKPGRVGFQINNTFLVSPLVAYSLQEIPEGFVPYPD